MSGFFKKMLEFPARTVLVALSRVYGALTALERLFFSIFRFLVIKPDPIVVSVGNLTTGGTGKTPVLLELLTAIPFKNDSIVLSRGYKSPWERSSYLLWGNGPHPPELTDEALLVNAKFPSTPILLGKNRYHNAMIAQNQFEHTFILLDDGFQYRRIEKDVEILLFDAGMSPQQCELLPLGRLREPIERAAQADAILLTRCESTSQEQIDHWCGLISSVAPETPLIKVFTRPRCWIRPDGSLAPTDDRPQDVIGFCGIGSPRSFVKQLQLAGCNVVKAVFYRDHHRFIQTEIDDLVSFARSFNATLVCTEKDRIKIPPATLAQHGIFTLSIGMEAEGGCPIVQALGELGIFDRFL